MDKSSWKTSSDVFTVALPERQGKHLLLLLVSTKSCSPKSLRAVIIEEDLRLSSPPKELFALGHFGKERIMYIRAPHTRMVFAVWSAFIFGKKCGYVWGLPFPSRGVGEVVYPFKKT